MEGMFEQSVFTASESADDLSVIQPAAKMQTLRMSKRIYLQKLKKLHGNRERWSVEEALKARCILCTLFWNFTASKNPSLFKWDTRRGFLVHLQNNCICFVRGKYFPGSFLHPLTLNRDFWEKFCKNWKPIGTCRHVWCLKWTKQKLLMQICYTSFSVFYITYSITSTFQQAWTHLDWRF